MNISPTDITIIVPAYNAGLYIEDTLRSVLVQSWPGWRCIVVDDGSTDDSAAIAGNLADPRISVMRQENAGVSSARNRGLAAADTAFVMFLDADDILHPTALERLRVGLIDNAAAVMAFGASRMILANGAPYPGQKPLRFASYPTGAILGQMVRENFLANGGQALIRREAATAIGGFCTTIRLSEDWVFWCRLAVVGQFHYIGAPPEVFSLRAHSGSVSGNLSRDWNNHLPALNAVLGNVDIAGRFQARHWASLSKQVWASHRWEAGRVNFTYREFGLAFQYMLSAVAVHWTYRRIALLCIGVVSMITNRSLVSRLRFREADANAR